MNTTRGKAAISLTTGLEDAERVTVAFLVAVGAAEQGRPTMMFLTKEAVRLADPGVALGMACDGCPPLPELMDRYEKAGGRSWSARSASIPGRSTPEPSSPTPRSAAPCRCGSGSATGRPRSAFSAGALAPHVVLGCLIPLNGCLRLRSRP